MPSPKIVIVLTKAGIESVTVSAPDSVGRTFGYELCKTMERELSVLSEAMKQRCKDEAPQGVKQ